MKSGAKSHDGPLSVVMGSAGIQSFLWLPAVNRLQVDATTPFPIMRVASEGIEDPGTNWGPHGWRPEGNVILIVDKTTYR